MNEVAPLGNLMIRAVNRCGKVLATSRMGAVNFDLVRLLDDATRRSGFDDFGTTDFLLPLSVLLDAYTHESELTLTGRIAMREDILQSLMTRLHIHSDRTRYSGIAEAGIDAPIFITGLPRSGTTFLHNLLAEDAGFRTPAGWEVMYPSPPPGARANGSDPRIARAQRRMQQLYWLAPGFRVIHPLNAELPQECIAIASSAFVSDAYPTMCHVPSYQSWLDQADLTPSYEYHRRFLQHLQGGQRNLRWLLKAPAHLFGLRSILEVYPDARIIFMHRDPLEVLPSLANLTLVLRAAFSDRHEPEEIGRELISHWAQGMRRARELVLQLPDRQTRCMEISYQDLTGQPVDTIARLYRHFGLELDKETLSRMRKYLVDRPKDQFGKHRYSLAQFGLDAGEIERAFEGMHNYCTGLADRDEDIATCRVAGKQ
ncbi:MAG: sulfotransferase [Woeseia sp.]